VIGWGAFQVPHLPFEERGVLGVDPARRVERYEHGVRGLLPLVDLVGREPGVVDERSVVVRPLGEEPTHGVDRRPQVPPGHEVGVGVVVDDRRVLVRSGHGVDVEAPVGAVEAQVVPQPRRLDEDLPTQLDDEA
jgi:hypothetical protein